MIFYLPCHHYGKLFNLHIWSVPSMLPCARFIVVAQVCLQYFPFSSCPIMVGWLAGWLAGGLYELIVLVPVWWLHCCNGVGTGMRSQVTRREKRHILTQCGRKIDKESEK